MFSIFFKFLFPLCYLCLSLSSFVSLFLFLSLVPSLDVCFFLMLPLILTSFIRSISYVISSFLAFCLGCVRLPRLNGNRGNGTRSVATTVERRFYNESLYLGKRLRLPHCIEELPFSFTPCQVLRQCGESGRCCSKGVLRFIADNTKVTPSQNIFALMKWEFRKYCKNEICFISWQPYFLSLFFSRSRAHTHTSRSVNVTGPCLFLPYFFGYIPVQDLVLFFASISSPRGLRIRFSFPFVVPTCWWTFPPFHLLICVLFSSVRCSFSFCRYLCRLTRLLGTTVSFSLAICSPLFNVGK